MGGVVVAGGGLPPALAARFLLAPLFSWGCGARAALAVGSAGRG